MYNGWSDVNTQKSNDSYWNDQAAPVRSSRYTRSSLPRPSASNNKEFASETRAYLNREIYNDYKRRFEPHEQQLLDAVTGKELLNERLSAIRINERNAFASSQGNANRSMGRYGLTSSDGVKRSSDLNTSLARASTLASSENSTRQHIHDRDMTIIAGGNSQRRAIEGLI